MTNNINIGLVSPSKDGYSETFIQAHRELLNGQVKYYYWGRLPEYLDGKLLNRGLHKIFFRLWGKLFLRQDYYDIQHAFQRSLRKERIEVVLAEYGPTGAECMRSCRALKIPLLVHFHGVDASCREEVDKYAVKYREMFEYASKIIVVSTKMRGDLLALGAPEEKIVLNSCGPNDSFFELNPAVMTNKTFVAIGRFVDKKAPYYVLLSFAQVYKLHPEVKLIMAGNGPLLETCRNLAVALGCGDAVEFPGAVTHDTVMKLYQNAFAFVQHSIIAANGDSEGTPVSVLEAGAAGLPVIATRHAGIADVVIDGETGCLVNEHDWQGMAERILELLDAPLLAAELGQAGRQRVAAKYTMSRHIGVLDELIRECKGS
ncbi:MAG: glycosyltransferase [Victivallaceae bacterium]